MVTATHFILIHK